MKTSVIEVHDMLSVFSIDEVEKRIGEIPGVESVTVNFATENATVRYDETRLDAADIKSAVRQREYARTPSVSDSAADAHKGHAAMGEPPASSAPAAPTPAAVEPAAAGAMPPGKAMPSMAPDSSPAEPAGTPEGEVQKDQAAPDKS